MSQRRLLTALCLLAAFLGVSRFFTMGAEAPAQTLPLWIWLDKTSDNQTVYFRQEIMLPRGIRKATLAGSCDNRMTVFIDGKQVAAGDSWENPVALDVTRQLRSANKVAFNRHVIAVEAHNSEGPAGLLMRLTVKFTGGAQVTVTDAGWRVSATAGTGWNKAGFDDSGWARATVVAKLGDPPWVSVKQALRRAAAGKAGSATPVRLIKVKKDFKVELLYSVPRDSQGSWVSLCADDKGRLIASDQSGKLYRITPGPAPEDTRVEELPVDLGEAQGLLWAFNSLYVVVNRGRKYETGLWRVTSSKGDDVLDTKEKLRRLRGAHGGEGGEHGPHAVVLGPDRKSLYIVCGNHTALTELAGSKVPRVWGEDFLTPRLWDASGHAVDIMAPAGCIYKTDLNGKDWTLISMGYRNTYDIAFNRAGELFAYDADMEWDMNLPWYRPTRLCHAVPGSEFGWRGGTGKMYEYHPDNLPPVVNIGPGSPTGIVFGYGAKFPAKYQNALFLCDWSYGKLYAVHLKPEGCTYTGEAEEFLNGLPLPLTDIVVNPVDGAIYFAIGGRSAASGLYRLTYTGSESTAPAPADLAGAQQRAVRKKLESFYEKKDPEAVAAAWPYLSSPDRFLRFAARTVLEFQEPATWQDKALAETNAVALTHALIGLARVGEKTLEPRMLEALERVDWTKLTSAQKIDYLRAYQLTFKRMGAPDPSWNERAGKRLDAFYPARNRAVNVELCKLICYLEPPDGVTKTLALLAKAPTQEEQIEYTLSLRTVKTGWTKKQHEEYFNWFHKAAGYRGGHSFQGFMRNIRNDAVKSLSRAERAELKEVLAHVPQPTTPKFTYKERPAIKKYTVAELLPIVEKGLTGRNFNRGRNLFGEAKCFACHRFNNEGGGTGPDLTAVSGRYGPRDLLESIIEPSKVISDQYQAAVVVTTDGRTIVGRIVNIAGEGIHVNTDMLDPDKITVVNRNQVDTMAASKISMMPEGLIDGFTTDEILDLVAYLYSRGNRNDKMFRRER